jgi:hypothetical protein
LSSGKSETGTVRFPFVASIVFDPRVVTMQSPSHRGTYKYSVQGNDYRASQGRLLVAQGFGGIQLRGALRGEQAETDADGK